MKPCRALLYIYIYFLCPFSPSPRPNIHSQHISDIDSKHSPRTAMSNYKPCRGTGSVARTASAPAAPAERATVGEARGSHCAAPPAELLRSHRANLPRDRCWRNLGGRDPWWAFLGWTWTVGKIWQLVCFVWDVNIGWGVDDAEQIRKWWAMAMAGLKHPHVSNTPSIAKNAFTR